MGRAAAVGLLVLALAGAAGGPASGKAPARPVGVTWGPRHFTDQLALRSWLSSRGIRYQDWLRRHPQGRYLMTHPAPRPKPAAPPRSAVTTPAQVAAAAGTHSIGGGSRFLIVLYGLAAVLLAAAAVPLMVVALAAPGLGPDRATSLRATAAGIGLSLALGATISLIL
jgi:hypothetical protein